MRARRRRFARTLGDSSLHLAVVVERNTKLSKILITQISQNADIFDAVFSENLRILGQAKCGQPIRDRRHPHPLWLR